MPLSTVDPRRWKEKEIAQTEAQRVRRELEGLHQRLESAGHPVEKRTPKLHPLLWILRQLQRPEAALLNVVREVTAPSGGATPNTFDPLQAFWRGLSLQESPVGKDIAQDVGISSEPMFNLKLGPINFSPSPAGVAGLGLDIMNPLDPLHYVKFGGVRLPSLGGETPHALLTKAFGGDIADDIFTSLTPQVAENIRGDTVGELISEVMKRAERAGIQQGINVEGLGQRLVEGMQAQGLKVGSRVMPLPRKAFEVSFLNPYAHKTIAKATIPGSEQFMSLMSGLGSRVMKTQLGQAAGRMFSTKFVPEGAKGNVLERMVRRPLYRQAAEGIVGELPVVAEAGHTVADVLFRLGPGSIKDETVQALEKAGEAILTKAFSDEVRKVGLDEVRKVVSKFLQEELPTSGATADEFITHLRELVPNILEEVKPREVFEQAVMQRLFKGQNPLRLIPEAIQGIDLGLWNEDTVKDLLSKANLVYGRVVDMGFELGRETMKPVAEGFKRLYREEGATEWLDTPPVSGKPTQYVDVPESTQASTVTTKRLYGSEGSDRFYEDLDKARKASGNKKLQYIELTEDQYKQLTKVEPWQQTFDQFMQRDDLGDLVVSENLKRLHEHKARVQGLDQVSFDLAEDYLKKLEGVISPLQRDVYERALQKLYDGDFAGATELTETLLSRAHDEYLAVAPVLEKHRAYQGLVQKAVDEGKPVPEYVVNSYKLDPTETDYTHLGPESGPTFKTAQGSTYEVIGNTTKRDKSFHIGHQSRGPQPQSAVTAYVDQSIGNEIAGWLGNNPSKTPYRFVISGGKLKLVSKNVDKIDDWVQKINAGLQTDPAVGLVPIEGFKPDGRGILEQLHVGNPIIEFHGGGPTATPYPQGVSITPDLAQQVQAYKPWLGEQAPTAAPTSSYQVSDELAQQAKPYVEQGYYGAVDRQTDPEESARSIMLKLMGGKPESKLAPIRGGQAYQEIMSGLQRMSGRSKVREQLFMEDLSSRIFKGISKDDRKLVMQGALYKDIYDQLPEKLRGAVDEFRKWHLEVAQVYQKLGTGFTPLEVYVPFVITGSPLTRDEAAAIRGLFGTGVKRTKQEIAKALATEAAPHVGGVAFSEKSKQFLVDLLSPSMGEEAAKKAVSTVDIEAMRGQINDLLSSVFGGEASLADNADDLIALIQGMDPFTKRRTTRAIDPAAVNKVLGREWLTEDAAVAMARRGIRAIRGEEAGIFLQGILQKYGLQIKDLSTLGALPPGYAAMKVVRRGSGQVVLEAIGDEMTKSAVAMPMEFAKAFNDWTDLLFNTESKTAFGRFYDGVTRVYKTMAYMWNPGHIPRDLGSNVYNLWLMDVRSTTPYVGAWQLLRHPFEPLQFAQWNGTGDELFKNLRELGLLDSGGVLSEFLQVGQDWTFNIGGEYTQAMRKATRATDNYSRLVGALDRLMKGDTIETAVSTTKKFLFDYGDLTSFEKRWMKRIIPFYTWMRKNIPLQIESVITQPGKLHTVQKYMRAFGGVPSEEEAPDFIREAGGVHLPGEGGGLHVIPNLAYGDLANLPLTLESARDMLGSLNPLIRAPLEMLTNMSLFSGQPLERYAGEQQNLPFAELLEKVGVNLPTVPKRSLGYLLNQIPPLRNVSVLANPEHPRRGARALSIMGGPQMYPDEWVQSAAAYESRDELRALIRYLQDKQIEVPTLSELNQRDQLNLLLRDRIRRRGILGR